MKRRDFVKGFAGLAATLPLAAHAQQRTLPVIGILSSGSPESQGEFRNSFVRSLAHAGYVEGNNIAIEYRWADDRPERLPALAADLARRDVSVMVTLGGTITVLAAKGVTRTIPIVFVTGGDPVRSGVVASLNRPADNVTGIHVISGALNEKRLELLRELAPKATNIAVISNLNNPNAVPEIQQLKAAARTPGFNIHVFDAGGPREIDTAFDEMTRQRADALLMFTDPFLNSRVTQIVTHVARHSLPAIYGFREFTSAGGLMSYGASQSEARRLAGLQVARILQGQKPSDLPVQQSTKIELVINMKTAKSQGLTFPLALLGRADEVIE